jgi:hypothetical protein
MKGAPAGFSGAGVSHQLQQEVVTMAGCGCGTKTAKTAKAPAKTATKKAK